MHGNKCADLWKTFTRRLVTSSNAFVYVCVAVKLSVHSPIMPFTVPNSTEPWVGVELSPRFCNTSEPWQKTLTNSPRWNTPTSCRCCRSSSVVAALITRRTIGEWQSIEIKQTPHLHWRMCDVKLLEQKQTGRVQKPKSTNRKRIDRIVMIKLENERSVVLEKVRDQERGNGKLGYEKNGDRKFHATNLCPNVKMKEWRGSSSTYAKPFFKCKSYKTFFWNWMQGKRLKDCNYCGKVEAACCFTISIFQNILQFSLPVLLADKKIEGILCPQEVVII